jgi:DNA-binding transcriptional ArsR family regulator
MAQKVDQMAGRLAALGHPVRLAILRRVVQGPEEGTPAGEIQAHLGIPASTLSHHLATLSEAGLVTADRQGTFLRYRAAFEQLRALTAYLWEDCCSAGKGCC